jgi:hypothetical protein
MKIEVDEAQHKEMTLLVKDEIRRLELDSTAKIFPEKIKQRVAFLKTIGEQLKEAVQ